MLLIEEYFYKTVAHLNTLALASGGRLALIGDMNAAPEGGLWGYSLQSKTREADRLTLEWAHQCGLKEVPNIQRHATWKACLHQRKAILDRAWVSPPDLQVSSLSVQWNTSQPIVDHAMIMFRLPRTAAGLRYAGACRPFVSHWVAAALPGRTQIDARSSRTLGMATPPAY